MTINYFFKQFWDWMEVWALLLIPLPFVLKRKNIPRYLKPIKLYVFAALFLNLVAVIIWKRFKLGIDLPYWLTSNNFVYNIHSIVRFLLFSWFFIALKQHFMYRVKVILPFVFIAFVIVNFTVFEDFYNYYMFSSLLLATEAALLLFYCLQYFIFLTLEDRNTSLNKQPGFWIVTGLSIYVAVSFIVFLFFNYLIEHDIRFAIDIFDVHNIGFLILCISIALAFYEKTD
ncbi:MAG TPA: hypothetical protein VF487_06660 [Chitinophagaceae bacterium]